MLFVFFLLLMVIVAVFILPSMLISFLFLARRNSINMVASSMISKLINELNNRKNYTHSSNMSKDEALKILGLNPEATHNEINNAYYNLMKLIHPDKGGSAYFAQKPQTHPTHEFPKSLVIFYAKKGNHGRGLCVCVC